MSTPVVFDQKYERLVKKLPSLILLSIVGSGLAFSMPWALANRGTIEILPRSTTLNLWAGETTSYQVNVRNGSGEQATVTLQVRVLQTPVGGNALDLQTSYPTTVTMGPGTTTITVHLQVHSEAMPGQYVLAQWVAQA